MGQKKDSDSMEMVAAVTPLTGQQQENDGSEFENEEFPPLRFPLYVVRDFRNIPHPIEGKLVLILLSIVICVLRWIEQNDLDYVWIWVIGFVYWTAIELALAMLEIRKGVVTRGKLFGRQISTLESAMIRGSCEGSAITIFGLGVADMTLEQTISGFGILSAILQVMFILQTARGFSKEKNFSGVTSRRPLLRPLAVLVLTLMGAYSFYYYFRFATSEEQDRMLWTLFYLSIWGYVWHFVAYAANVRWFEWHPKQLGGFWVQALGMTFDSVIEIALAYILFLAIYFRLLQV